ncbi:crossover junction endodeoxyribonuclease RuvC [Wolbachia endosymbiont of Howardula sp.]|uniref:crossover junction endodeoxyribonuclease RuvC n=1 Tax=Wolbachia endosymbiont of Howardula sp. TaxID=2916816 RepID=UPI00217F18D2|nr:crossover junction endodeoxyribonuclease RuvC [Wolbachia endosymbiont of Howardula sp.]UWI83177.1 crossover junction endodeoxyribonuclease RuvC [Wolbachia endosymbiont of Howardula sp.]
MIIIGLDPGINNTGWAVIRLDKSNNIECLGGGTISNSSKLDLYEKLYQIFIQLQKVISIYNPNEAAIEKIFINSNPQSSLTLGYARGVAMLALKTHHLSIFEYNPNHIKKSITGYGHATKQQMIFMVHQIVKGWNVACHHACDALATAICHVYHHPINEKKM